MREAEGCAHEGGCPYMGAAGAGRQAVREEELPTCESLLRGAQGVRTTGWGSTTAYCGVDGKQTSSSGACTLRSDAGGMAGQSRRM